MLKFDKNQLCVGCTACVAACPCDALQMTVSENGFYISQLDSSRCTQCGACTRVCPVLREAPVLHPDTEKIPCLSTYALDLNDRKKSTSGGVFFELAKSVLDRGGMVCGCIWDENFVARHVCTDDIQILEQMRGSKYVQSDMGKCFQQIRDVLKTREVFFVGTPCQVTALHNYIGESDKLLLCALICGGTPSPAVWRLYRESLERRQRCPIVHVNMRSKAKKWLVSLVEIGYQDGTVQKEALMQNIYGANYVKGLTLNNACFTCKYKLQTSPADLIIGDHWGISAKQLKESENMGMSAVLVLTDRGADALQHVQGQMHTTTGTVQNVTSVNPPLLEKHKTNPNRDAFFASMGQKDMYELLKMYMPKGTHSFIRNLLYKTNLYIPVYTAIWKWRNRNKNGV